MEKILEINGEKHLLIDVPNIIAPCDLCSISEECGRDFVSNLGVCIDRFGGGKNSYFTKLEKDV